MTRAEANCRSNGIVALNANRALIVTEGIEGMGRDGDQPGNGDGHARVPESQSVGTVRIHPGIASRAVSDTPAQRVPVVAPALVQSRPSARTSRRITGLIIVGMLLWAGLMALYWVRASHSRWSGLQWAGQILFTLLVAILLTAIIGSIWGIDDR